MAVLNQTDLTAQKETIRTETGARLNTAQRIGVMFGNLIDTFFSLIASKQDTLVSGTNVKTINGVDILGPGNIVTATDTGTQLNFQFPVGSLNTKSLLIAGGLAGTFQSMTESNTTTRDYEKNGVAATIPFTLAINDTLKVTITRTTAANAAYVRLNTNL